MSKTLSMLGLLVLPVSCGGEAGDSTEDPGSTELAATCGVLASGTTLARGGVLYSCNNAAVLAHQTDGNVVVYKNGGAALWATNTQSTNTSAFAMQTDGNIVLYTGTGGVLWANNKSAPGAYLALQDDCNLVEWYNGSPIWATNVGCSSGGGTSGSDPVLIGAGDIANPHWCGNWGDPSTCPGYKTGQLVNSLLSQTSNAMVFNLGDDAYGDDDCDEGGSWADFTNGSEYPGCPAKYKAWAYNLTPWGSSSYPIIGKTLPNPGNHEYNNCNLSQSCPKNGATIDAQAWVMNGYYSYFNGRVPVGIGSDAKNLHYTKTFTTPNGKKWLYISLNTGFCFNGYTAPCDQYGSEWNWLNGVLSNSANLKISKGGSYTGIIIATHIPQSGALWDLSAKYNVDVWLVGHDHNYAGPTRPGSSAGPSPYKILIGSGGADNTSVVGKIQMHDSSWEFWFYSTGNGTSSINQYGPNGVL